MTKRMLFRYSLVFASALLASGCGRSTVMTNGVVVHVYRPAFVSSVGGSRSDASGTIHFVSWESGPGAGRVEFRVDGLRLQVDGVNYGPVNKGDVVDLRGGAVSVNGVRRTPSSPTNGG